MTSEGAIPRLRELLAAEGECCVRLEPILEAERAAAASYDYVALLACLKEREAVQAEWERVSAERRRVLRERGTTLAVASAADPELAATVASVRRLAGGVRRAQQINAGVIRATLAQVTDLLTVIRRELPTSRYDDRATLNAPLPATRGGSWTA
jgi:flagellar biosynthesis/type III secretory pathway chaperone